LRRILRTFLALGLLLPTGAWAQTLRGVVIQAESGNPVGAARVELPVPGRQTIVATTDSLGTFRMAIPKAGRFALKVSHIAYTTLLTDSVDVGLGENVAIEVRLGTSPIAMAPLVVTSNSRARSSGFYDRMRSQPNGRFLTRSDIESRGGSRVSDVLRTVPGISVVRVPRAGRRGGPLVTLITMRGAAVTNCEPAIFLDGSPIHQAVESTLDDMLQPDMIEAVEIYAGNAGAPSQYVEAGKCGVLLIWTRLAQNDGGPPLTLKRALITAGAILGVVFLIR
jgi:hypothetical protein